jgi:GNAT superfamily N-acetyltransferase
VNIRITNIDSHTFPDLFPGCRACLYWERPEMFGRDKGVPEEARARAKAEWFENLTAVIDPCGKLVYVDDEPVGYCQYAPPEHLPGVSGYGKLAAPVGRDAAFISCLTVIEQHQRKGLGRRLLREVLDDVRPRGFRAVETFARNDSTNNCSGPTQLYLSEGFGVVATEIYPNGSSLSLVRLELGVPQRPAVH